MYSVNHVNKNNICHFAKWCNCDNMESVAGEKCDKTNTFWEVTVLNWCDRITQVQYASYNMHNMHCMHWCDRITSTIYALCMRNITTAVPQDLKAIKGFAKCGLLGRSLVPLVVNWPMRNSLFACWV